MYIILSSRIYSFLNLNILFNKLIMKLIKVIVLKLIKTKTSFYALFNLRFFKFGCAKGAGSLIRNYLIKNVF